VIAMENDNWRQAANKFTGGIQQIYQNPGVAGDNADDFNHTLPAIIISKGAHEYVDGVAANANDLSDLFKPGSIPNERRLR
jgi:hypothetical protein